MLDLINTIEMRPQGTLEERGRLLICSTASVQSLWEDVPVDVAASEDEEDADFTVDLDQMLADADAAAEQQASYALAQCVVCVQCPCTTMRHEVLLAYSRVICLPYICIGLDCIEHASDAVWGGAMHR